MGMNYYIDETRPCPNCDRDHSCQVHIGKSSAGWKFLFAAEAIDDKLDDEISVEDFRQLLKYQTIRDEYGEEISYEDFWKMVEDKQKEKLNRPEREEYRSYYIFKDGYEFMKGYFS